MKLNFILKMVFTVAVFTLGISISYADSDLFPPQENAPDLTSYVSDGSFNNTLYISPNGDDSSGDGSFDNPWQSFLGATSGGSGTPVSGGDIIYLRGGVYPTHDRVKWKEAYYSLKRSGTADDYIVITKYQDETPQFTGGEGVPSFSIHGDYIVIDNLTFISGGNFGINLANNIIVQNSTFAQCADGWGDQVLGTCIGIGDSVNSVAIRNNYFGPSSTTHAIKNYTSNSITNNVQVLYNRFNNITPGYGVISHKGVMQNWEIAYNRFQDCSNGITYGANYGVGSHSYANIHHNVFDNMSGTILQRVSDGGELVGFHVHDNVVIKPSSSSQSSFLLMECCSSGTTTMGEFYNNVMFGLGDVINPQGNSDFTNYPSYWNYNAYRSSNSLNTAENQNSLGVANWEGNAQIVSEDQSSTSDDIMITGNSGDRFYYLADDSQLRGHGRNDDNIGGFTWGNEPVRPRPPFL